MARKDGGSSPKTIVLVTNQFQCERIIHCGKALADATRTELIVFSVQSSRFPQNPLALEHLYNVSKQNGAVMSISYGDDAMKQIVGFIKHNNTRHVFTGMPEGKNSILYKIWAKFTHVRFFTVDAQGNTAEVPHAEAYTAWNAPHDSMRQAREEFV